MGVAVVAGAGDAWSEGVGVGCCPGPPGELHAANVRVQTTTRVATRRVMGLVYPGSSDGCRYPRLTRKTTITAAITRSTTIVASMTAGSLRRVGPGQAVTRGSEPEAATIWR